MNNRGRFHSMYKMVETSITDWHWGKTEKERSQWYRSSGYMCGNAGDCWADMREPSKVPEGQFSYVLQIWQ